MGKAFGLRGHQRPYEVSNRQATSKGLGHLRSGKGTSDSVTVQWAPNRETKKTGCSFTITFLEANGKFCGLWAATLVNSDHNQQKTRCVINVNRDEHSEGFRRSGRARRAPYRLL
jgi:hypothetical protein